MTVAIPGDGVTQKVDGDLRLRAAVGESAHEDRLSLRVYPPAATNGRRVHVLDPVGRTTGMLRDLGCTVLPAGDAAPGDLLVIGHQALSRPQNDLAALEERVRAGGRVLVMNQDPQWLQKRLGWRVAHHGTRRVFPIPSVPAFANRFDRTDLLNWRGHSDLLPERPDMTGDDVRPGAYGVPCWGWKWGNRHQIASAALEKPHRSSWRPLLECEFDWTYSPLLELDLGRGRLIWCALDLEEHAALDPAAEALARRLLASSPDAVNLIVLGRF